MPLTHLEVSEIVAGHALKRGIDPQTVNIQKLVPPYNEIIREVQAGQTEADLMVKHGWNAVNTALEAYEATRHQEIDWVRSLDELAAQSEAARRLNSVIRKMERGEGFDTGQVMSIIQNMDDGRLDFVPLGEVEAELNVWNPTGYAPWDRHIGGLVDGGLTVIGGPPGTGKTSLLIRLMTLAAKRGQKVGFFSMEMTLNQIAMRLLEIEDLTIEERNRIYASEEVCGVHDVYAKAARLIANHPDLAFIGIDFADLMVERDQSEQVMGEIYRVLATLAKRTETPVVLLSQLSRRYESEGGRPRVTHLRYSGMAEAMASLICLLYNPGNIYANSSDDGTLPYVPDTAYIIVGKSRYGFKEGTIGAFRVDWDGAAGWGPDSHGWWILGGT